MAIGPPPINCEYTQPGIVRADPYAEHGVKICWSSIWIAVMFCLKHELLSQIHTGGANDKESCDTLKSKHTFGHLSDATGPLWNLLLQWRSHSKIVFKEQDDCLHSYWVSFFGRMPRKGKPLRKKAMQRYMPALCQEVWILQSYSSKAVSWLSVCLWYTEDNHSFHPTPCWVLTVGPWRAV